MMNQYITLITIKMRCVKCKKEAVEGSMKEPYCKRCFHRHFKNYGDYFYHMKKQDEFDY